MPLIPCRLNLGNLIVNTLNWLWQMKLVNLEQMKVFLKSHLDKLTQKAHALLRYRLLTKHPMFHFIKSKRNWLKSWNVILTVLVMTNFAWFGRKTIWKKHFNQKHGLKATHCWITQIWKTALWRVCFLNVIKKCSWVSLLIFRLKTWIVGYLLIAIAFLI